MAVLEFLARTAGAGGVAGHLAPARWILRVDSRGRGPGHDRPLWGGRRRVVLAQERVVAVGYHLLFLGRQGRGDIAGRDFDVAQNLADMLAEGRKNKVGYLATGVPGALKGWVEVVETYGRLDLEAVLQPAIRYAERGFHPSPYLIGLIQRNVEDLGARQVTADILLRNGGPPTEADTIVQHDLAQTLRTIASEGADALYGGALGQTVVDDIQKNGGLLTMEDLRNYRRVFNEVAGGGLTRRQESPIAVYAYIRKAGPIVRLTPLATGKTVR